MSKYYERNSCDKVPMIIPDVDECPVCGNALAMPAGKERMFIAGGATPGVYQQHSQNGALISAELYWTCNRCGVRWNHGQFKDGAQ